MPVALQLMPETYLHIRYEHVVPHTLQRNTRLQPDVLLPRHRTGGFLASTVKVWRSQRTASLAPPHVPRAGLPLSVVSSNSSAMRTVSDHRQPLFSLKETRRKKKWNDMQSLHERATI